MKLLTTKRILWVSGIVTILLGGLIAIPVFNLFHAHEHCMKQTGMMLQIYAQEHTGKFPFHTNGFGDSVLMLAREDSYAIRLFTAPGDNGSKLRECLASGADVLEENCTRAYVQGLTTSENPEIALVFDRYPTRGGDHFRRPWGPLLREICLLDGSMEIINETNWPAFRTRQLELLVAAGIKRSEAEKLYAPIVRP